MHEYAKYRVSMQEYIHCKNESARCQMRVAAIGASQPVAGSLMPKYLDRSFFTLPLDGGGRGGG